MRLCGGEMEGGGLGEVGGPACDGGAFSPLMAIA